MGVIYKITNKINGKVYIGLTTVKLEERWQNHLRCVGKVKRHLYISMEKYGVDNFSIEKIDETDDFKLLGELERKYIKEYDSTNSNNGYNMTMGGESNQLDGNPRAKFTVEDVIRVREIYNSCSVGCKKCWEMFKYTEISYSAFEKIYEGTTWKSIMPEVYSMENKKKHQKLKGQKGEINGNAILGDDEVMEIRKFYEIHSLKECYEKYGEKFKTKASFRSVIDRSYLHLPIYSKIKKMWLTK